MYLKDKITFESKRFVRANGFLRAPATLARVGVQEYIAAELGLTDRNPTDKVRVYRPPEEVFSAESMASFAELPVTDDHPSEMVNAYNAKDYAIGFSGEKVLQRDGMLEATLTIFDANAISKIEQGKVEISNGYESTLVFETGTTPTGETYDAIQTAIKGNHIALVTRGRAGRDCRIADQDKNTNSQELKPMIIDGISFDLSEQATQAVTKVIKAKDAEKQRADAAEGALAELKAAHKAELDKAIALADDYKSKILDAAALDKMIADRVAELEQVRKVAPDLDTAGKSIAELKREAVKKAIPSLADSASDAYVQARFDILLEDRSTEADPIAQALSQQLTAPVVDAESYKSPSQLAREKYIERNRNAWNKAGAK